MDVFLQQLVNGISLGAIYALIALGYTMIYGVLRFINFAHGDVFMIGAYVGFYAATMISSVFPIGSVGAAVFVLLSAMIVCAALGASIEFLAYRPLRSRPKLTVLITAIGVSLFLEYVAQLLFGATPKGYPEIFSDRALIRTDAITINVVQAVVICVSLFLMFALRIIVLKTKIGTAMRAVSFNQSAASLMGINISSVITFTFVIGSALAAAGGVLYGSQYPSIEPLMGIMPGLKAFVAAVLGGIGNIPGAALGAMIIGIVETFAASTFLSTYRDAIAFAILIGILIFKPSGLLGHKEIEKV
ncbi:MAG TPA: branched-chain amino acid ABC transporter permease [Candidatus Kapabacteria bacterium]|nr:branched-chain amino acid ABC transporter permease [Candidatus Kapabacteria bacterium]